MPSFKEFVFGKKDKIKQKSTLNPQQDELMALISEGLTKGSGPFASLFGDFDKGAFEEGVTKPALANFQENILPQLQEKFIAGNQVLGSGMRRGQLKASNDLQNQLATLMYNAQQDQQKNKLAGIQSVLAPKAVENVYKQGSTGALTAFAQGAGQGVGQAAGAAIAG